MNPFRRTSVRVWTARLALLLMLLPVGSSPLAAAQGRTLPPTVLVLPVAPTQQADVTVPATLSTSLTRAMSSMLRSTGKFDVVPFDRRNPSVVRALEERRLREAEVNPPFEETGVIVRLARDLGADYALAGVIEDYRYDAEARKASLSVSVQWVEAKSGRVAKSVAVSVEATGAATSTQEEVNARVAAEAVNRVLQELAIGEVSMTQPTAAPAKKPAVKRNNVGWILLGIGLIAAIASGARSNGAAADTPPPPPFP
ncbi:MAG: hypothetical protein RMM06_00255 [Armatimonadota bacterium]|nr:DUF3280 domain-containing protein [bacterium]MCS7309251.1 DUF3280 domain-containing protein [Armatimonadota bacterium]MDW8103852.1 hypothetical protein [Armatimonadota bacterium]MDW8289123.1 hypothetical protein [Armatimonadota bacterium]